MNIMKGMSLNVTVKKKLFIYFFFFMQNIISHYFQLI